MQTTTPGTAVSKVARRGTGRRRSSPGCQFRLCIVEVTVKNWSRLVVSCVYPAEPGLVVKTRSEKIDRIRKTILELLMAHAPDSTILADLAKDNGARRDRFLAETCSCTHRGLCARHCAEVVGRHAVGFIDRGIHREIAFLSEIALTECPPCKACFPLCPTSFAHAAYVLIEALSIG